MAIPQNVQAQADLATSMMKGIPVGTVVNPTTPEPPPTHTPPPVEAENWQHKYLVLQGKYNAELGNLRNSIIEKDEVIAQLNRMVADLYQRIGSNPPPGNDGGAPPQEKPGRHVPRELTFEQLSEDDFSGYGDEVRNLVKVTNAMASKVTLLEEKLKTTETDKVQNKWEAFSARMRSRMADWETINNDPAFIGWLGEKSNPRDPWTRMDALKHYAAQGDDAKAIEFFQEFKTAFQGTTTPTPGVATPSLSEVVQPSISAATPQTPVSNRPAGTVTAEQFKKASDDFAHKLITFDQWKSVADAFQRSLPQPGR